MRYICPVLSFFGPRPRHPRFYRSDFGERTVVGIRAVIVGDAGDSVVRGVGGERVGGIEGVGVGVERHCGEGTG
jgi:hypothetical protein